MRRKNILIEVLLPAALMYALGIPAHGAGAANTVPKAVLMKQQAVCIDGHPIDFYGCFIGNSGSFAGPAGVGGDALIVQSIFQAAFIFVWNQSRIHLRFYIRFRSSGIRKVRQYSTYQFFYSLLNCFAGNLDNLLIGKTMGSVTPAYYDKGYRLMMYPVQNLAYVINPIIHPVLSEYQTQKECIFSAYLKITKILSVLGMWISAVCCCCARRLF